MPTPRTAGPTRSRLVVELLGAAVSPSAVLRAAASAVARYPALMVAPPAYDEVLERWWRLGAPSGHRLTAWLVREALAPPGAAAAPWPAVDCAVAARRFDVAFLGARWWGVHRDTPPEAPSGAGWADREEAAVAEGALGGLAPRAGLELWSPRPVDETLRTLALVGLARGPWTRVRSEATRGRRPGRTATLVTASTTRAAWARRAGWEVLGVPWGGEDHARALRVAGARAVSLRWWEAAVV